MLSLYWIHQEGDLILSHLPGQGTDLVLSTFQSIQSTILNESVISQKSSIRAFTSVKAPPRGQFIRRLEIREGGWLLRIVSSQAEFRLLGSSRSVP